MACNWSPALNNELLIFSWAFPAFIIVASEWFANINLPHNSPMRKGGIILLQMGDRGMATAKPEGFNAPQSLGCSFSNREMESHSRAGVAIHSALMGNFPAHNHYCHSASYIQQNCKTISRFKNHYFLYSETAVLLVCIMTILHFLITFHLFHLFRSYLHFWSDPSTEEMPAGRWL